MLHGLGMRCEGMGMESSCLCVDYARIKVWSCPGYARVETVGFDYKGTMRGLWLNRVQIAFGLCTSRKCIMVGLWKNSE